MGKRLRRRSSKKARAQTDADVDGAGSTAPQKDELDHASKHDSGEYEHQESVNDEVVHTTSEHEASTESEPALEQVHHKDADHEPDVAVAGDMKKKRKRSRKRKRSNVPHPGPDTEFIEDLSNSAKKAIAYTQQYLCDKEAWKFSKQRQNWLLRHVLWSPRIYELGRQLTEVPQEEIDEQEKLLIPPSLPLPDNGSWIADEYVSVVAFYLASMMGLAKQVRALFLFLFSVQ